MPSLRPRLRRAASAARHAATSKATNATASARKRVASTIAAAAEPPATRAERKDREALAKKYDTPLEAFGLHPILGYGPAALAVTTLVLVPFGHWHIPAVLFMLTAAWVRSYVGATPADHQLRRFARRLVKLLAILGVALLILYLVTAAVGAPFIFGLAFAAQAAVHSVMLYLEWREDRLILGQTRATHRIGFLNTENQDVRYGKISTSGVKQAWWMRPIKAGVVTLDSDADNESLVATFALVLDPEYVQGRLHLAADRGAKIGAGAAPYDPTDPDRDEPRA